MEVTNRFKGLDLIDRVPAELWTEVRYIVQEPPYQTLKSVPCWLVNSEIRLIIFFAAKDGEALYNQHKKDQELIVAQIMNSLLPNSDLN